MNNEKMKLDWMFKMSFASDVARVRTDDLFKLEFSDKKNFTSRLNDALTIFRGIDNKNCENLKNETR